MRVAIFLASDASYYEMITACRAFEGKSQLSVFTAILEKDPEPVSVIRPATPPLLDRVIRACLAKDPADRIQTAHDVATNLQWAGDTAPGVTAQSQEIPHVIALLLYRRRQGSANRCLSYRNRRIRVYSTMVDPQ